MTQLVRFQISENNDADEGDVIVEVAPISDEGVLVSGGETIEDAAVTLTEKLASVRTAVAATLRELGGGLEPDVLKVTVGVRLTAEAGAIIAKTSTEGNLRVQMEWNRGRQE